MERLAEKRAKERQPILRRKNGKKSLLVVLLVSFTHVSAIVPLKAAIGSWSCFKDIVACMHDPSLNS